MAIRQLKVRRDWTNRATAYAVGTVQAVDVFDAALGERPEDGLAIDTDQLAALLRGGVVEVVGASPPATSNERAAKKH